MLGVDEVARLTQERCWPIIKDTQLPHEQRVMAFLEMTATLATYCDISAPRVENELREQLSGPGVSIIDGVNILHVIGDTMANGYELKTSKKQRKDQPNDDSNP